MRRRLIHMHVAKAGGQWLREALTNAVGASNACPLVFEPDFVREGPHRLISYSLLSGHFGYEFARRCSGCKIVVLRNPIERVLSLFRYFKGLTDDDFPLGGQGDTALEMSVAMDLMTFLESNEAPVISDFHNAQVWQVAWSHLWPERYKIYGIPDDELLQMAQHNLTEFDVVGVSEAMPLVISQIRAKSGLGLNPFDGRRNESRSESVIAATPSEIRKILYRWTYLDCALYEHVLTRYVFPMIPAA